MMGGFSGQSGNSDTWVSVPVNGAVGSQWQQITSSQTFAAYQTSGSAYGADHQGRFYVVGGSLAPLPLNNPPSVVYFNTTWMSTNAQTWTAYSNTTGQQYSARTSPSCVVDSQNNVYVIGGGPTTFVQSGPYYHPVGSTDVWKSSNFGSTFTLVTANGGFAPRYSASVTIIASSAFSTDVITMAAGCTWSLTAGEIAYNDVLASTHGGLSFYMISSSAPWSTRCQAAMAQSKAGALVLMGGRTAPAYLAVEDADTWVSLDGGYTWVNIQTSASWSPRVGPSIALDSNERIVVLGGANQVYWASDATVYTSSLSLTNISQWIGPVLLELTGTAYVLPPTQAGCIGLVCLPTSTTPNCAATARCTTGTGTGTSTSTSTGKGTATSTGGTSNNSTSSSSSGLSSGAIAGIVVGAVVFALLVLCVVVVCCCFMSTTKKSSTDSTNDATIPSAQHSHSQLEESQVEMADKSHNTTDVEAETA
jgi:hypothetical protein